MNLFKTKTPIDSAIAEIENAIEQRSQLQRLLVAAEADSEQAQAQAIAARSRLDAEEAELALSGSPGPSGSSRAITEAEVRLASVEARMRGLSVKLAENREALARQQGGLTALRRDWNRERIAELMPEYLKAAAAFAAVNRKMYALALAVNDETAKSACQVAAALSPETGVFLLQSPADMVADGYPDGWHQNCWSPDWKRDAKAVAVFEANATPLQLAEKVTAALEDIQNEERQVREAEAEAAARAKMSPGQQFATDQAESARLAREREMSREDRLWHEAQQKRREFESRRVA